MRPVEIEGLADEWVRLRTSDQHEDYERASWMEMPLAAWQSVLDRYPDMAKWVAHAKRTPDDVLRQLAAHPDDEVRWMVASKRQLDPALPAGLRQDPEETVRRRAERFADDVE